MMKSMTPVPLLLVAFSYRWEKGVNAVDVYCGDHSGLELNASAGESSTFTDRVYLPDMRGMQMLYASFLDLPGGPEVDSISILYYSHMSPASTVMIASSLPLEAEHLLERF
jgi:hypothetical protein